MLFNYLLIVKNRKIYKGEQQYIFKMADTNETEIKEIYTKLKTEITKATNLVETLKVKLLRAYLNALDQHLKPTNQTVTNTYAFEKLDDANIALQFYETVSDEIVNIMDYYTDIAKQPQNTTDTRFAKLLILQGPNMGDLEQKVQTLGSNFTMSTYYDYVTENIKPYHNLLIPYAIDIAVPQQYYSTIATHLNIPELALKDPRDRYSVILDFYRTEQQKKKLASKYTPTTSTQQTQQQTRQGNTRRRSSTRNTSRNA